MPVQTIEFWKPALDTYNYNYHTNIQPQDITNDKLRNEIEAKWKNQIDLIIGGFPCKGFSMPWKRSQIDPRNQLYKYTIDMIKRIEPKFFA